MRILIDVDGVLADFTSSTLAEVNAWCGHTHTKEEVLGWDIFDYVCAPTRAKKEVFPKLLQKGFCESIQPLPGAEEGMAKLQEYVSRSNGELFVVTSPIGSPTWTYEREGWLRKRFGLKSKNIVHCSSKYIVSGNALIDDKPSNVYEWAIQNYYGAGILWDQHHNRDPQEREKILEVGYCADSWDGLIEILEGNL